MMAIRTGEDVEGMPSQRGYEGLPRRGYANIEHPTSNIQHRSVFVRCSMSDVGHSGAFVRQTGPLRTFANREYVSGVRQTRASRTESQTAKLGHSLRGRR